MRISTRNRVRVLAAGLLAAVGNSATAEDARLRVQPDLCMTTAAQPKCQVRLQLKWESPVSGNYCVVDEAAERTIECWPAAGNGSTTDERSEEQSFTYVLQDDRSVVHASASVKVLAARSKDRRRNRRRRHVWSVL